MPVTAQAKRALRKDRRRTVANLRTRRGVKKAIDQAQLNPTAKNLKQASSIIDRAVKKHLIHKNKASRIKSQLAQLTNQSTPVKATKTAIKSKPPKKTTKKTPPKSSK